MAKKLLLDSLALYKKNVLLRLVGVGGYGRSLFMKTRMRSPEDEGGNCVVGKLIGPPIDGRGDFLSLLTLFKVQRHRSSKRLEIKRDAALKVRRRCSGSEDKMTSTVSLLIYTFSVLGLYGSITID